MVGSFIDRAVTEPIFSEYISEMSGEELESTAAMTIWLCETMLRGPWDEDVLAARFHPG